MTMMQVSRTRLVIGVQSAIILFLSYWMAQEYVNNLFLRDYVASFWAANWFLLPAVLIVSGGALVMPYVMRSRQGSEEEEDAEMSAAGKQMVTTNGLVVMDVCPHCDVGLRMIAADRYQCRKCKRYYKR